MNPLYLYEVVLLTDDQPARLYIQMSEAGDQAS